MADPESPTELVDAFWSVARRLRHVSAEALARWDLSPSQARALSVLARHGGMRPGELARHLRIAPRSATEVVDDLADRGLCERVPDPRDRRATQLRLTDHGVQAAEGVKASRGDQAEALFGHLSAVDRAELTRLLGALRAHVGDLPDHGRRWGTIPDMTDTDAAPVDKKKVRAFARHLFGVYTHGALSYLIDIGHRTGLFTAAAQGPATAAELAGRAACDERYVREWLGAMVTAEIMTLSPDDGRYALPPEHAAALTGGGSKNMGPMAAMVTLMGRNLDGVERAFREGGGVPYSAFAPGFTGVMDELNRRPLDELLVDAWLPLVPGFVDALTSGIRVADVGCGTGHALALLAAAFPASTFVGYDLSEDALDAARAETAGLGNVTFEVADAATFSPGAPFDAVLAIDAVHDQADPAGMLRSIHAALVPGGRFVMVDMAAHTDVADNVGNPFAPWIYAISTLHCMTVSLAADGAGLGAAWGQETARTMLADAGFGDVETHPAPGQALNLIYVTSRPG